MSDPEKREDRPVPAPAPVPSSVPATERAPGLSPPRVFWAWWLGLVAFGFLVRAVFVWRLQGSPFFDFPLVDASEYHDWAQRIRAGRWGWSHVPIHGPFYPFVLAAMWAGTESFLGVYLCQAGIGALTVGMTYALGRRCFGDRAGRIAGVLTAFAGPLVAYTGIELCETLVVALNVACLCAVARAAGLGEGSRRVSGGPSVLSEPAASGRVEGRTGDPVALPPFDSGAATEPRPRSGRAGDFSESGTSPGAAAAPGRFRGVWWLAAGLFSGLSAITRPNWVFVVPVLALWILVPRWSGMASRGRRWAAVGLLSLGTAIPIVPVEIEHYGACGEFVLLQANGGLNLYLGNRPGASGFTDVPPGIAFDSIVREARLAGATTPGQQNAFFMKRVREFWREHPGEALRLLGKKALLLCSADETDPSFDLAPAEWEAGLTDPLRCLVWGLETRHVPHGPRDAQDPVSTRIQRGGCGLPVLVDFGILLACAAVSLPRLLGSRNSVLLALVVIGYGVATSAGAVCGRYRLPMIPLAGVLSLLSYALAVLDPLPRLYRYDLNLGLREASLGDQRTACGYFALEARLRSGDLEALYHSGLTQAKLGQFIWARHALEGVVLEAPWFVDAQGELGNAKKALGDFVGAEKAYRAALAEEPANVRIRSNLGLMLVEQGRCDEAIGELEHAVGLDRKAFEASKNLARAYAEAKRYPEAVAEARRAISLKEDDAAAHYNLALTFFLMGDRASARPEAERARSLGHDRAEALLKTIGN
ncbi:MAG: tetratricopeptide repeat protein [Planctomycetes bacterium]|nr:tetratricopeptide repeat protein [Planctomycetota bacterium]